MISLRGSNAPIRLSLELLCSIPPQGEVKVTALARDFGIRSVDVLKLLGELRVVLGVQVRNRRVSIAEGCRREAKYRAELYWKKVWDPNLD